MPNRLHGPYIDKIHTSYLCCIMLNVQNQKLSQQLLCLGQKIKSSVIFYSSVVSQEVCITN